MDRDPPGNKDTLRRAIAAPLSDQRGSSFVQALILLVLVLGAVGAARALGGRIGDKAECAGQAIAGLSAVGGAGPCAEGVAGAENGSGPVASLPTSTGGGDEGAEGQGTAGVGVGGPGDPASGDPAGGDPAGGDPAGGDPAGGDPASGGPASRDPAQPGQPGTGTGSDQPGSEGEGPNSTVGSNGSVASRSNGRETSGERTFGGAPATPAEDPANQNNQNTSADVGIGGERTLFDEEGALAEKSFFGDSETLSGGFGTAKGTAFANASLQEGVAAGASVEGKVSAVNLQGEHELPGGIEESHEVDVLSVKGSLEGKAGISKDVVGASVSGEAGANIAEAQIEGKKVFNLPFTDVGLEIGGSGSAAAGANIGGEASAGFFKGEDGKSRLGLKGGFKAALGLGLGGKLSLNLVF